MRRSWQEAPIVHAEPPACPHCGMADVPIRTRTTNGGDSSLTWLAVCRHCSEPFNLVFDPPELAGLPYWGNQRPGSG